jgi:solute:Na+ symporter, SSS family
MLHAIDWTIIVAYLTITFGLGYSLKSHIHSMKDFIGAGQRVGPWLSIATMAGTETGLITIMYSAEKGYLGGFAAFHIAVVGAAVPLIVGMTGFIVARLRETGVLTIPEYYNLRFGKSTRVLGGVVLVLAGVLNMGLFLKVGAMFIAGMIGVPASSIGVAIIMVILLVLVLGYTMMGGMMSVIITDYLQFVLLSLGFLVTTGLAIWQLGLGRIFSTISIEMGEAGFNPFISTGEFGLSYVVWMIFTAGLVSCAIWPTAVARALTTDSPETTKKQYRWASLSFLVRFMVPYFWGICAFVFFKTIGQGLWTQSLTPIMALPAYLSQLLPIGLTGLLMAAMIAAFMSTHDSYLLCWSAVIVQDIIAPLKKGGLDDAKRIQYTRWGILGIGVWILYWGLVYPGGDAIWDYMAVTGAIYFTGAFSVLVGGLYWKRASRVGANAALVSGLVAIVGLAPAQHLLGVSWGSAKVGLVTVCLSILAMIIGSLVWPDLKESAL